MDRSEDRVMFGAIHRDERRANGWFDHELIGRPSRELLVVGEECLERIEACDYAGRDPEQARLRRNRS